MTTVTDLLRSTAFFVHNLDLRDAHTRIKFFARHAINGINDARPIGRVAIALPHLHPCNLPCNAHESNGLGDCREGIGWSGGKDDSEERRELAARPRDPPHFCSSVSDGIAVPSVRHEVDRSRDGDNRLRPRGKGMQKVCGSSKVLLGNGIRRVRVNTFRCSRTNGKRPHLGDVAANEGRTHLVQNAKRGRGT